MRNVDIRVLASYYHPRIYSVLFADGVDIRVWASNAGQAKLIAIKRRQADVPGKYQAISAVVQ